MSTGAIARQSCNWSRIDGIDCLRALAIFYVLLNHVNMRLRGAGIPYTNGLPHWLVVALVWQAQRGVQIFFTVSGFLITSMSIRRWGALSGICIRQFYRIRFARIAPLLFALLVVLSALHLLAVHHYVVPASVGGLPSALLAALTFRIGLLEAHRGYLPASWDILWSLSVEEIFYLGFPLACRLLPRRRVLCAFFAFFILLGPFARTVFTAGNPVWREYSYLGGMDAIALGCLTALVFHKRRLSAFTLRTFAVAGFFLLSSVLFLDPLLAPLHLARAGLDMTVVSIGAALLLVTASQDRWRAPQFLLPILLLGRRSYEIYLTHMFVVFVLFDGFVALGSPLRLVPALFLAVVVCSAAVGEIVASFFTEPANRALRVGLHSS